MKNHSSIYIDRVWHDGAGAPFNSINPATGDINWLGSAASAAQVDNAVSSARGALTKWSDTPIAQRIAVLQQFARNVESHRAELIDAISREVGKPRWESATEVDAIIGKIAASVSAYNERRAPKESVQAGALNATRYKPHGVVAVLGPFNFPGHLPNGHIVPALLAGNTVVYKPSELASLVAELIVACWHETDLPAGVLNVVQGERATGEALVCHPGIDGVYFTGSFNAGVAINKALADQPGKIVALELGGNNPLIVHRCVDRIAAAYWTIQSAFLTAGQRCASARRVIVPAGSEGNRFLDELVRMTQTLNVGAFDASPEPFCGPVISDVAADRLLADQALLLDRGGVPLVEMKSIGPRRAMLAPGIVDLTAIQHREDRELFGPLLQVIRVEDFDAAITEANATQFGLSAALFSDDRDLWSRFYRDIRAGVVNWNRPTVGASGTLPFGGTGNSGNHRPSGSFAADYCSYPVASIEAERLVLPETLLPGVRVS